ncbi:MAG: hypothetical protein MK102_17470, partial [Fuerstiella sp.]|nr:hypothetical protein [Fuerstiella sp.]
MSTLLRSNVVNSPRAANSDQQATPADLPTTECNSTWQRDLAAAILTPRAARMELANPSDPLLQQVLPVNTEVQTAEGFVTDAVGDQQARRAPGMLQKYHGRALLIAAGSCAVHCRYCFRRSYPYANEPRRLEDW